MKTMKTMLEGCTPWPSEESQKYLRRKWWQDLTWNDVLDRTVDMYPDRLALIDANIRWTWAEFSEQVDRLALALIDLGIHKDDRAIVQMPNRAEYLVALFALSRIGAVVVPGLIRHSDREINHLCQLTHPVAWLTVAVSDKYDQRPLINRIHTANPELRHIIVAGEEVPAGTLSWNKLLSKTDLTRISPDFWYERKPAPTDIYLIGLTGGTTGLSKGVPRTHNDHITDSYGWSKSMQVSSRDIGIVFLPIGHNAAHACVMYPMIIEGGTIILLDSTQVEDTLRVVEREKATFFVTVPALLNLLVNNPDLKKYNLQSLRFILSGAAHNPPEIVKKVFDNIGCDFINAFGMMEGLCTLTRLWDTYEAKCNTVGQPVSPYTEFKIVGDQEKELPTGEEGELVCKGPAVFRSYYKTDNQHVYTNDGFFRTGDLARTDTSGRLIITGRKKDIINRGGENISATELEDVLMTFPKIMDVAIVGMPDPIMGEKVCAFIKPMKDSSVSLEELLGFFQEMGVSKFMWPERLEVVEDIPLSQVGKPDKKLLRQIIADKLAAEVKR